MRDVRILVVEDRQRWQDLLKETFEQLGASVRVDVAASYDSALRSLANNTYDLTTIDLSLLGGVDEALDDDQVGLDLLREIRDKRYYLDGCGLIVLTATGTIERVRAAFRFYEVDDVIDKNDFDDQAFLAIIRVVLRKTWLRRAAVRANARYRLTITCSQDHVVGNELAGPDRRAMYAAEEPIHFNPQKLVDRADRMNILLLQDPLAAQELDGHSIAENWRKEARDIGEEIYETLGKDQRILGDLNTARNLAYGIGDLWVQFNTPSLGLGLPFELLHDQDNYLCLKHILSRRLIQPGPTFSRKPEPFHAFVGNLVDLARTLRVLVVGANSDGRIPQAEAEARAVAIAISADLTDLGIDHELTTLIGPEASQHAVRTALRTGRYHLFHYAGHGRYSDDPRVGGLVFHDGTLNATDLNLLSRHTELHMVYLSCCLSARNSTQLGRNDFSSMLQALVRADVPIVLGYRWTVPDTPARDMALAFYRCLWRSFSPGAALLEARRDQALSAGGSTNETWLAPVLVVQNA